MEIIKSSSAPKVVGPYSQAIKIGDFLYSSGQIGINPSTNKLVNGGAEKQTIQVCKNLGAVLNAAGLNYNDVVKTTIFLDNMSDYLIVNEIYGNFFSNFPARSTIEVSKLPLGAMIEIEIVASFIK